MYAVTRTGTTVKSFQNDVKSVTLGSNLGIIILPLINLRTVIPTVITRNTTARATDKVDVNLKESASRNSIINLHIEEPNTKMLNNNEINCIRNT